MTKDERGIMSLLRAAAQNQLETNHRISVDEIADQVFDSQTREDQIHAGRMYYRQLGRAASAHVYQAKEEKFESEQAELFGYELQDTYPQKPLQGAVPGKYIPLDECSPEDIRWNIFRLEKEISAKSKHVRALRIYLRRWGTDAA